MNISVPLTAVINPPINSNGVASSIPVHTAVAQQNVIDAVTDGERVSPPAEKRLRAVWVAPDATEHDLGKIVGFAGGTSFSGTHGSLTLAWPDEKNPRTSGEWSNLLVPDDRARIKINLLVRTSAGEYEIPALLGVPSPDGINETYGGKREVVEIKIEDVTGVAARMTNYSSPSVKSAGIDPKAAAKTVLGPIPFVCLYRTVRVSGCIEPFPNALMAADDLLIVRQNKLNPLAGQKRIRYGDRDGRIVYRLVEDPESGATFNGNYPASDWDFTYKEKNLAAGFRVGPKYSRYSVNRINPYIDIASRLHIKFLRGGIDEVVEVHEIGWRLMPRGEQMFLKTRRQNTN